MHTRLDSLMQTEYPSTQTHAHTREDIRTTKIKLQLNSNGRLISQKTSWLANDERNKCLN